MKPQELLLEANAQLMQFISSTPNFQRRGTYAVFLYDNTVLSDLLDNIAVKGDLDDLTLRKNQQGVGIVDQRTDTVWVGAIDETYEVFWASTLGNDSEYFQGKLIRDLTKRLQALAEIFSTDYDEREDKVGYKPRGRGVERVIDFIKNSQDPDYSSIPEDLLDTDINDLNKLKNEFERKLKSLKAEYSIDKKRKDKLYNKIEQLYNTNENDPNLESLIDEFNKLSDTTIVALEISDLESFLENESHLFDEEDSDSEDNTDVQTDDSLEDKLDAWTEDFQQEYPGLRIDNIYDFDPNQ